MPHHVEHLCVFANPSRSVEKVGSKLVIGDGVEGYLRVQVHAEAHGESI